MSDDITAKEIVRRLNSLEAHVRSRTDLFVVDVPYTAGAGAVEDELAAYEKELGVSLPAALREALLELAGTRWHWLLRGELKDEWDADMGASGGTEWLSVAAMRSAAGRLSRARAKLGAPILPFAVDIAGAAAWLGVANVKGETLAVQAQHDGDVEAWDFAIFIDDWSRTGFRVDYRWEDQPESVVEHFKETLGLTDDDENFEDGE